MTPDHHPRQSEDDRPRLAFIYYGMSEQESLLTVASILDQIDDIDTRFRIMSGYVAHGSTFAAYLTLPDVDPSADPDGLVRGCLERYDSSWDTLAALIDEHLGAHGWDDALDAFRIEHGIDEALLDWNQDAWLGWLRRSYDLVPLDGRWFVFDKPTSSAPTSPTPTKGGTP